VEFKLFCGLAVIKGLFMALFVAVVTNSVTATALIASVSSIVTGCFLLANTLLQDRLQRRHMDRLDRRISTALRVDAEDATQAAVTDE